MDMSDEEEERVRKEFERIKNQRTASDEDRDTVLNHEDDIKQKSLTGALKKFSADIGDLLEMIKAYYKKEYTEVPVASIAMILATLAYVFSPIDIIPDFIPVLGLTDDATMVAACLGVVHNDVDKFRKWRKAK